MKVIAGLLNSVLANKLGYKKRNHWLTLTGIEVSNWTVKDKMNRKKQHSSSIQIIIEFAHYIKYLLPFIFEIYNVKNLMNTLAVPLKGTKLFRNLNLFIHFYKSTSSFFITKPLLQVTLLYYKYELYCNAKLIHTY